MRSRVRDCVVLLTPAQGYNVVAPCSTGLTPSLGIMIGTWSRPHRWTAAAKSRQSCPTLCDPIDSSPPGFPVPEILQARTLEWVAIPSSVRESESEVAQSLSHVRLFTTPWTAAHQVPPSLRFSRQEHWSGLPFPSSMHESEKWKWSCSVAQSCPTLCNPMDCSPPDSSVPGIFQARVLEWVAIAFSNHSIPYPW